MKKVCPIMSNKGRFDDYVECIEEACALWVKVYAAVYSPPGMTSKVKGGCTGGYCGLIKKEGD